jgi:glycosyltransferase involved in cell wall biosynthesis
MKEPTPILFLSDAVSTQTGLARIHRDLYLRAHEHLSDVFRIGTAGFSGSGSRGFPPPQYNLVTNDWICLNLPEIWEDFAGNEKGIIFTIWDASRLGWFSRPELSEELSKYQELKSFLTKPSFKKWIYSPLDASGPNDRLTWPLAQRLLGFDRILAYGKWGEDVIRRTLGDQESEKRGLTSLPHGINIDTFYPRERLAARGFFFSITGASTIFGKKDLIQSDEVLIGIVCTNQSRKDFGVALEAVAILSRQRKIRLWLHTDVLERVNCWSIPSLLVDFGLLERTIISLEFLSDDALAKAYSACDVTIAPGAEGWGFPIAESLACGTPVIHGDYAGGAELVPSEMRVSPVAFRLESLWACKRPVYNAEDWAAKVNEWIGKRTSLDSKYFWENNWEGWEKWFREGVK